VEVVVLVGTATVGAGAVSRTNDVGTVYTATAVVVVVCVVVYARRREVSEPIVIGELEQRGERLRHTGIDARGAKKIGEADAEEGRGSSDLRVRLSILL
jgi:hypothetical protein